MYGNVPTHSEDRSALNKLVDVIKTNFNDRAEEVGVGVMMMRLFAKMVVVMVVMISIQL